MLEKKLYWLAITVVNSFMLGIFWQCSKEPKTENFELHIVLISLGKCNFELLDISIILSQQEKWS